MSHKNPQQEERSPGLLLHSLPHLRGKQILKILTPEQGLVTLIGRATNAELVTPFHFAEWIYRTGRGEMGLLIEGSVEERFSFDEYAQMEAAGKIAADLLHTQMPGKHADAPFALARAYFRALKQAFQPETLSLSFRLKLLRAEGLFSPETECKEANIQQSVEILAYSRSFAELQAVSVTETLAQWVAQKFIESM